MKEKPMGQIVDAINARLRSRESVESIAKDYDVPIEFVRVMHRNLRIRDGAKRVDIDIRIYPDPDAESGQDPCFYLHDEFTGERVKLSVYGFAEVAAAVKKMVSNG